MMNGCSEIILQQYHLKTNDNPPCTTMIPSISKNSHLDLVVRFFNLDFRQEGEVGCENKVDIRFLREILHKY